MKKISKVSLTMLVLTLGIFVAAGTASANCIGNTTGAVFGCGSVVTESCTFDDDMICATDHGLIIGAAGASCGNPIVIDGDGFTLSGTGTAIENRRCQCAYETVVYQGTTYGRTMKHLPFMCADGATPEVCYGCMDSGILNALTYQNEPGKDCQEGFDNVTVKNLEITGWCHGIFMAGTYAAMAEPPADTLTCIVIEGNSVHDCGNSDCGNFVENEIMRGQWEIRNHTSGIYLGGCGLLPTTFVPGPGGGATYAQCNECVIGDTACPDLVQDGDTCVEQSPDRCIVRHNLIYNQKGCGCQGFYGGIGISMNGSYCGCNEVAKNVIKHCAMSGIQTNGGTNQIRFHGNYLMGNGYGGFGNGCGGCTDNYFYSNICEANYGPGIGWSAPRQKIRNNISINNKDVYRLAYPGNPDPGEPAFTMYAEIWPGGVDGTGISLGHPNYTAIDHELKGNTCVGNETYDIKVTEGSTGVTGDQNKCRTAANYTDTTPGPACGDEPVGPCTYCAPERLNCKADLDHDCDVDADDYSQFVSDYIDYYYDNAFCCPSPW